MSACADCRRIPEHGVTMIAMVPGRGVVRGEWFLCDACWRVSMRDAEDNRRRAAARLAAKEAKRRKGGDRKETLELFEHSELFHGDNG